MLDQLIVPLNSKVGNIITPSEGSDQAPHFEIKKAYLDFTLTIMGGPLYMVYISPRKLLGSLETKSEADFLLCDFR